MTSRKDRRQELRRQAILEVAEAYFARQGVASTTLDQVGAELGVTKASIYYYYKNKDDLVLAVLQKSLEKINRKAALGIRGLADPLEKLKVKAHTYALATVSMPSGKIISSSFDLLMANDNTAALLISDMQAMETLIREAEHSGLIRDIRPAVATRLLYEALNKIPKWCTLEAASAGDVFENVWTIFIQGIRKA